MKEKKLILTNLGVTLKENDESDSSKYEFYKTNYINRYSKSSISDAINDAINGYSSVLNKDSKKRISKLGKHLMKNESLNRETVFCFYISAFFERDSIKISSPHDCVCVFLKSEIKIYYLRMFSLESFTIPIDEIESIELNTYKVLFSYLGKIYFKMKSGIIHCADLPAAKIESVNHYLLFTSRFNMFSIPLYNSVVDLNNSENCNSKLN